MNIAVLKILKSSPEFQSISANFGTELDVNDQEYALLKSSFANYMGPKVVQKMSTYSYLIFFMLKGRELKAINFHHVKVYYANMYKGLAIKLQFGSGVLRLQQMFQILKVMAGFWRMVIC